MPIVPISASTTSSNINQHHCLTSIKNSDNLKIINQLDECISIYNKKINKVNNLTPESVQESLLNIFESETSHCVKTLKTILDLFVNSNKLIDLNAVLSLEKMDSIRDVCIDLNYIVNEKDELFQLLENSPSISNFQIMLDNKNFDENEFDKKLNVLDGDELRSVNNALEKDINRSFLRMKQLYSLAEQKQILLKNSSALIKPEEIQEINDLLFDSLQFASQLNTSYVLRECSDKLSLGDLYSLKSQIRDFSYTRSKKKQEIEPDAIDEKWVDAPQEIKELAKAVAKEGLTSKNRESLSAFLAPLENLGYLHTFKYPDASNPDASKCEKTSVVYDSPHVNSPFYQHTKPCLALTSQLQKLQWFIKIFKSDSFINFKQVRQIYGPNLFQPEWLSTQETITKQNTNIPKAIVKTAGYHCTKTPLTVVKIINSSIKCLHEGMFSGAFYSTRPDYTYGEYVLCLKSSVQRLAPLDYCGRTVKETLWVGLADDIPMVPNNLSAVLLEDNFKFLNQARYIRHLFFRKTGKFLPVYTNNFHESLNTCDLPIPRNWHVF